MKSINHKGYALATFAFAVLGLIALPGFAGAHGGSHKPEKPAKQKVQKKTQKVSIGFTALNGSSRVSCAKPISGLGTTGRSAKLNDLRFYVSGMQLLRKGGGAVNVKLPKNSKWNYTKGNSAVTLIDLENGTGACAAEGTKGMNAVVRGTVPKGKYVGARYSVSVPYPLNHTNLTSTPAPLNLMAMGWSWQFGRKFMKIELSEDTGPAWASKIFFLHVGSTDCVGDPAAGEKAKCALPNRNLVTLKKFNPVKQKIALDFKKLFGGVNVAGESMGGMDGMDSMEMEMGGCMSFTESPDCAPIFRTLGMKLGSKQKTSQTAFRAVRK